MTKILTVTEMARGFADYINRVAYRGERFILTRGNKPVAEIRPLSRGITGAELIERLKSVPRLTPEEAEAFGRDIDEARKEMGTIADLRDPWED